MQELITAAPVMSLKILLIQNVLLLTASPGAIRQAAYRSVSPPGAPGSRPLLPVPFSGLLLIRLSLTNVHLVNIRYPLASPLAVDSLIFRMWAALVPLHDAALIRM